MPNPALRSAMLLLAALLAAGCNGQSPTQMVRGMFNSTGPGTPAEAARQAFNVHDPDKRRAAINKLSNAPWGGKKPYLKTYRLLVDDPDPTVRAACLRALGQHGKPKDVSKITPYLQDDTAFVRWEAAKALQRLHHPDAIDPLVRALNEDEEADVRRASAEALAQYPRRKVFQALVGALSDDSYGVVQQAIESLHTLTGKEFGEDGGRWLAWARKTENLFEDQQPYYYPQYDAPPGFVDKMQFWQQPEQPDPKRPKGLRVASSEPQPKPSRSSRPKRAPSPQAQEESEPEPRPAGPDRRDSAQTESPEAGADAEGEGEDEDEPTEPESADEPTASEGGGTDHPLGASSGSAHQSSDE